MNKWRYSFSVILLVLILSPALYGAMEKTAPPFHLEINSVRTGEGDTEIVLSFSSQIKAPEVQLNFILPEDAEIISGDSTWYGALDPRETKELRAVVTTDEMDKIAGSVTVRYDKNTVFSEVVTLKKEQEKKPTVEDERKHPLTHDGTPVMEHNIAY